MWDFLNLSANLGNFVPIVFLNSHQVYFYPLVWFIWADVADTLLHGPKQTHWEPLHERSSDQKQIQSGLICGRNIIWPPPDPTTRRTQKF